MLLNQDVQKLFLVVWPPIGETSNLDIDLSFGFVFKNNPDQLCIISTDKDDMWTPCITFKDIPQITYSWSDFTYRMNAWMKSEDESDIEIEYYDVTDAEQFSGIVFSKVQSIELVKLKNNPEPFGVKVLFDGDYILSTPISDGNTVETSLFNKNENILNFKKIGIIEYEKVACKY